MKKIHTLSHAFAVGILVAICVLALRQGEEAQAFGTHGASWATSSAPYHVNANFSDAATGSAPQQIAAIQRAASEWTSAGQIPFQLLYAGTTNLSTVAPADGTNAVFYREANSLGALATATWASFLNGDLVGFDIEFFSGAGSFDFEWSLDPTASEFDLESVAVHEFGHVLGLAHSSVLGATMFPSVNSGSTANRTLAADDIAGAQALYGLQVTGSPSINGIAPISGWIGGGDRVTVTGTNFSGQDPQTITVDGIAATEVTVIDQNTLSFVAPEGVRSGFVPLSFSHQQGTVDGGDIFFNRSVRLLSPLTLGASATLELFFPDDAGQSYQAAPALGFQAGIPVASFGDPTDGRVIPIDPDPLFLNFQAGLLDNHFINFNGALDAQGRSFATVALPDQPFLLGVVLVFSAVTVEPSFPSTIKNISNAEAGLIQGPG